MVMYEEKADLYFISGEWAQIKRKILKYSYSKFNKLLLIFD